MKIIGICGMPCTGKTSLMRELIREHSVYIRATVCQSLHCTRNRESTVFVLGKYDNTTFSGTDTLSMSIINVAEKFLVEMIEKNCVILFEGDRLFCKRFLTLIYNTAKDFMLINLYISSEEQYKRRCKREEEGILQSNTFVKSRFTKYKNLCNMFPFISRMPNNTSMDQSKIRDKINSFIRSKNQFIDVD